MMNRLTNPTEIEDARRRIVELLDACGEWFLRERRDGAAVELRRGEWELRVASGALLLSYWGEAGARTWRVAAWEVDGGGGAPRSPPGGRGVGRAARTRPAAAPGGGRRDPPGPPAPGGGQHPPP